MLQKRQRAICSLQKNDIFKKTTAVFLLFFIMLFIFAITQSQYKNMKFEVGEKATEDIKAPFRIEDVEKYEYQVDEVLSNMEPIYRISPTVKITSKAKLTGYLELLRDVKLKENLTSHEKLNELKKTSPLHLEEEVHEKAINLTFSNINTVEAIAEDVLSQLLVQGIKEEEIYEELLSIEDIVNSLNLENTEQILVTNLLMETIKPNEFVDTIATERQMDQIKSSISIPVIEKNEIIVSKGEILDSDHIRIIENFKINNVKDNSWLKYLGIIIQLLIPLMVLMLFVFNFNPEILGTRSLYLILTSMMLTIILGKIMEMISPYLIPSALNAILVTLLVGPSMAIATNFFIVWIFSFMWRIPVELAVIMLIGNTTGILLLVHYNQRQRVLLNGMYMGAISFLFYLGYFFLGEFTTAEILVNGSFILLSGLLSGVIALGTMPIWENLFRVLTPLKLMELTNPNQPLLRRLFAEAPGTYHHSLIVGSLAESAAASIGANQLLAKAGSYYHDIGKLKRPLYFKENQIGIENPHDLIQPLESTEIIISHWKEGLKLGKDSKLPDEILDIIDQHHGNTLISYFYHKALSENEGILESEFRYGGKKPNTKEATIVMLADSVEAAVRSLKAMDDDSIDNMVRKVVKGKIDDGQLDESPITTREIDVVTSTFTSVLKGIYHERIEYPEKL